MTSSQSTSDSHDATIMANRVRASLRKAKPADIQQHVDRLDMGELWGSMLAADHAWRSRVNS
jgi:hypothetical protein